MTLYEVFQLLKDGERLVKVEGGGKPSEEGTRATKEERTEAKKRIREELANAAKRRKIKLPSEGL